jgi:hypothetical protein
MLWPGIKYSMYSFQWKSDSIIFIPRRGKAGLYIYFSINFIRNESPGEVNVVIRDVKTRYMLFPGIKFFMYSFQSKADQLIFSPRRGKAWLCIWFIIKFNINESPGEIKRCYSRCQNALYAVGRNKVLSVFIPIKVWFDNIYSPTC